VSNWDGGSTRHWRIIRLYVLVRDGYRCRAHADGWCAKAGRKKEHTCTTYAEHAHHVLGRARTGDDPAFIVAACKACNLYIGDPTQHGDPPLTIITNWGNT
jgi:hypothetical protein